MNALTPKLRTTLVLTLLVALASQVSWAQSTPPVHSAPVMIAADTERPAKDAADAPGPVAPIVAPLPGLPGAQGGEAGATRPVIPAMAATRPGITLGPGDVIYVNVADEPTVTGSYTIREDGKVIFPEVGEIMVQGLTVTAVADAIAEKLKKFMVNPVVAVNAVSMLPRVVTVIGQIGRPGAYDMRQFPSLLALLVSVGGFDPGVDLGQAMLLRNGDVTRLSLQQGTGALSVPKDMALQPGDTIIIPSQGMPLVSLTGAIARVGAVPLTFADTATKAVVLSGGPLPSADLTAAYILRAGKHIPLYLDGFLGRGTLPPGAKEVKVEAGDIIVVPSKEDNLVYVTGEAKSSMPLPLEKAGSLSKALSLSGGLTESANGKDAYILRKGRRIPADIKALLTAGAETDDPTLEAGDVVVIPKLLRSIYVTGQVAKPGIFPVDQADTVLGAFTAAGGPTEDANLDAVVLLRDNKPIPIDGNALLNKVDASFNLTLEPGDKLVVPKLLDRVYVMGAVQKTGAMPIQKGDTLIDILGRAGGVATGARVDGIIIARRPTDVEMRQIEATVRANRAARLKQAPRGAKRERPVPDNEKLPAELLADEIAKQNVKLYNLARVQAGADVYVARAGDLIYVPAKEEHESFWRGTILNLITSVLINGLLWHR